MNKIFSIANNKKLREALISNGMSERTACRRLRTARFKEWEIKGLKYIIKEYNPAHRGSLSKFWINLKSKEDFYHYMRSMGMSRATVLDKFTGKPKRWEMLGIDEIVNSVEENDDGGS